jgi:hypothetical protein
VKTKMPHDLVAAPVGVFGTVPASHIGRVCAPPKERTTGLPSPRPSTKNALRGHWQGATAAWASVVDEEPPLAGRLASASPARPPVPAAPDRPPELRVECASRAASRSGVGGRRCIDGIAAAAHAERRDRGAELNSSRPTPVHHRAVILSRRRSRARITVDPRASSLPNSPRLVPRARCHQACCR